MDTLLGLALMLSVPAYFLAQPLALLRWRGGWRKAALAPLVLTIPALAFSLYALSRDSNLWPLTLIFAAALGSFYLAGLWLLVRWLD
jgi:hypothetical protein